ncbi:hypothetical protein D3C83_160190 [compost metagenome]
MARAAKLPGFFKTSFLIFSASSFVFTRMWLARRCSSTRYCAARSSYAALISSSVTVSPRARLSAESTTYSARTRSGVR